MSHPDHDCEDCGVYHMSYSGHVEFARREKANDDSYLGMRISGFVVFVALLGTLWLAVDQVEQKSEEEKPTNIDFDNCKISTFNTNTQFLISVYHETPVKSAQLKESHTKQDSVLSSRQADYLIQFASKSNDKYYVQIDLEYQTEKQHEVKISYVRGEKLDDRTVETDMHDGNKWCRIFAIQLDNSVTPK